MYGLPPSRRRCTATVVRGICISDRMPSCMRAPPEAANRMNGVARSIAVSSPLITASPADVDPGLAVEHRLEARLRAHAHVVVRARDDELVRLDVLVEDELARLRTLDPEIFRHVAAGQEVADLRPYDVGDPVHDVPFKSPRT